MTSLDLIPGGQGIRPLPERTKSRFSPGIGCLRIRRSAPAGDEHESTKA